MVIDSSELDQRVTIEAPSVARDPAFGSEVVTWLELGGAGNGKAWAKIVDFVNPKKGGDEEVTGDMRVHARRTRITLRYRGDIRTDMRVQWPARSRTFQITGISELGRREGLELTVEEYSQ